MTQKLTIESCELWHYPARITGNTKGLLRLWWGITLAVIFGRSVVTPYQYDGEGYELTIKRAEDSESFYTDWIAR